MQEGSAGPVRELLLELRELHLRAGEPSMRKISDGIGKAVSHSTVHSMLRSDRLPRWEHLSLVVVWLGGDPGRFHTLWLAGRRAELADAPAAAREEPAAPAVAPRAVRHDFVLASYRIPEQRELELPFDASMSQSPAGTLDAVLAGLAVQRSCGWVGTDSGAVAGVATGAVGRYPVVLSPAEVADYYEGYSNSTVWPLYHDVIEPPRFEPAWSRANAVVNRRFAEAVDSVAADGATVWVHDYHLQLLPGMLRHRRPDLRIGFFLHIPFPPIELFTRLPDRIAILEGLLGADLVGFQRPLAADNFLAAVRYLLDLRPDGDLLRVGGRTVRVGAFPISVDIGGIERFATTEAVLDEAARVRTGLGRPRTVLLGIDRLDYTKGIEQRLEAYRQLLQEKRLERTAATLVQVVTASRENLVHYARLRDRLDRAVGSMNARYGRVGNPVVHYVQRVHDRSEVMALYRAADVMLVTPFRDGMNLVAKEYVAARSDNRGALVLSEFAGAAAELTEAVIVNPYDVVKLKQAIVSAVDMGPDEQQRRMSAMRRRLRGHDLDHWTATFLAALATRPAA
jgi:trehalose 6-phosphate synthase